MALSGVKRQVLDVLERTGAIEMLGRENLFSNDHAAIADLRVRLGVEDSPGAHGSARVAGS